MAAGRHGLQPEPLDRFVALGILDDVTEDQFPLAPGVAGIHEHGDIFAFDELHQNFNRASFFSIGSKSKCGRDDRQIGECPFAALDLELFGHGNREQMADRPTR